MDAANSTSTSTSTVRTAAPGFSARLRLILVGDLGVGKTSLVNRYVHKCFSLDCKPTTTDNLFEKEIVIAERPVTLDIWDIPGQERFQNLAVYYACLDGCILVYDVNIKKTFETLNTWHSKILEQVNPSHHGKFPFMLLGNKIDTNLDAKREVYSASAMGWCAAKGNITYFETSAKDNYNIDSAFHNMVKVALQAKFERDNMNFPVSPKYGEKGRCNIV